MGQRKADITTSQIKKNRGIDGVLIILFCDILHEIL